MQERQFFTYGMASGTVLHKPDILKSAIFQLRHKELGYYVPVVTVNAIPVSFSKKSGRFIYPDNNAHQRMTYLGC